LAVEKNTKAANDLRKFYESEKLNFQTLIIQEKKGSEKILNVP